MARYKSADQSPRFLAVDLEKQWLPGSFSMPCITSLRTLEVRGGDRRKRTPQHAGASSRPSFWSVYQLSAKPFIQALDSS